MGQACGGRARWPASLPGGPPHHCSMPQFPHLQRWHDNGFHLAGGRGALRATTTGKPDRCGLPSSSATSPLAFPTGGLAQYWLRAFRGLCAGFQRHPGQAEPYLWRWRGWHGPGGPGAMLWVLALDQVTVEHGQRGAEGRCGHPHTMASPARWIPALSDPGAHRGTREALTSSPL